jgi:small subunit ribosomal protein S8
MDKIGDFINVIKTGGIAKKETICVPYSQYKHSIADVLVKYGYLANVSKKTLKKNIDVLEVELVYNEDQTRIKEVFRVSKPSRRVYVGVRDIKPFKNGKGSIIISTPKGILSDRDARKEMVGGEVLFKIW